MRGIRKGNLEVHGIVFEKGGRKERVEGEGEGVGEDWKGLEGRSVE